MIQLYQTQQLTTSHKKQIFDLWNQEYPTGIVYSEVQELDNYLDGLADKVHLLLLDENNKVKGWMAHFNRANSRWFAMIIHRDLHGLGHGTRMLNIAKSVNTELNGWVVDHDDYMKLDGSSYDSPLKFYLNHGFQRVDQERFEIKGLSTVKISWKFGVSVNYNDTTG